MSEITLELILRELKSQSTSPLSIHTSGSVTYIIYGLQTFNNIVGYPVQRITEPSANHSYFDAGFLLESARAAGANGSGTNVDIKEDAPGTILLLTDTNTITYD